MLISKTVKVNWHPKNKKLYESKGYTYTGIGTEVEIKIEDLPSRSPARVEVLCDYCLEQNIITKLYPKYSTYNLQREIIEKDCCLKCKSLKTCETNLLVYGVENICATPQVYEKALKTRYERHTQEEMNEKRKNTVNLRYGIDFVLQLEEVKNQINATNIERYGSTYIFDNPEILNKKINTVMTKYNVPCTLQSKIIREKGVLTNLKKYNRINYTQTDEYKQRVSGKNHFRWNNGKSTIREYLRYRIKAWKIESIKNSNYKCLITGKRFNNIHHLYSFNKIIDELFKITQIKLKQTVAGYSNEELLILEQKCLELNFKYGLGICLCKEIHNLFHLIYGKYDNNAYQFEEFKTRLKLGEFDDFLKQNNFKLII